MKHNWTYKKLGEVATLTGGFTPKADELFSEGKYPYFKVSDMNTAGNEVVLTKTPSFVVDSKKCYPQGAIVFPKNGAAVSTNKKRILGQDSIVDLNTCAAILNSDIDIKFAYYWFYNLDFKTLVRGGALPTLDLKGLRSLQFPIPSLDEQQAIVRELDGINHLIDLQEEQLREYDRLAQSLFYTTFGDPATNPKGWEVKKLGEVAETTSGGTPSKAHNEYYEGGTIPWLRSGEVSQGLIYKTELFITQAGLDNSSAKIIPVNSVAIAMYGATVGEVGIIKAPMSTNQAVCSIFPNESVMPIYLLYFLRAMKPHYINIAAGGAQPNISQAIIRNTKLPLPPLALQQTFAAQIEVIEQQKALIRKSLEDTRTLLAARMQYYFE